MTFLGGGDLRGGASFVVASFQRQYAFAERSLERLGMTGERLVSCFVYDSFSSSCGRFRVVSRNEYVEHAVPMRFRGRIDPTRVELWCDGRVVGVTKNLVFAVNWLVLKMHGRGFMTEQLLA